MFIKNWNIQSLFRFWIWFFRWNDKFFSNIIFVLGRLSINIGFWQVQPAVNVMILSQLNSTTTQACFSLYMSYAVWVILYDSKMSFIPARSVVIENILLLRLEITSLFETAESFLCWRWWEWNNFDFILYSQGSRRLLDSVSSRYFSNYWSNTMYNRG